MNYQDKASGYAATGSAEFDTSSKGFELEQELRRRNIYGNELRLILG